MVSADDDLSYLREYEHVTLARILLARHTAAGAGDDLLAALALLARLLAAADAGGRTGTAIEVLVLQALAHQADGDTHVPWRTSSVPWLWPNQKASCACSQLREPRWPTCSTRSPPDLTGAPMFVGWRPLARRPPSPEPGPNHRCWAPHAAKASSRR